MTKRFFARRVNGFYGIFDKVQKNFLTNEQGIMFGFKRKYEASAYIQEHEKEILSYIAKTGLSS
jgi:hypothetical protein